MYCSAVYCSNVYCTGVYCSAVYCSAVYCIAMYCSAMYVCSQTPQAMIGLHIATDILEVEATHTKQGDHTNQLQGAIIGGRRLAGYLTSFILRQQLQHLIEYITLGIR